MAQRATESITVNASPETIYGVVTDFEHYADWVRTSKRIDVLTRDDQGRALEVEFRAAAFGRSTTYTLHYDYAKRAERTVLAPDPGRPHRDPERPLPVRGRRRGDQGDLRPRGRAAGADSDVHQVSRRVPHPDPGAARVEGAGRAGAMIDVAIGVDVGGTKALALLVARDGRVLAEAQAPTPHLNSDDVGAPTAEGRDRVGRGTQRAPGTRCASSADLHRSARHDAPRRTSGLRAEPSLGLRRGPRRAAQRRSRARWCSARTTPTAPRSANTSGAPVAVSTTSSW